MSKFDRFQPPTLSAEHAICGNCDRVVYYSMLDPDGLCGSCATRVECTECGDRVRKDTVNEGGLCGWCAGGIP